MSMSPNTGEPSARKPSARTPPAGKPPFAERKYRAVTAFQRRLNAVTRRLPGQTLLETTGRVSGLPRHTPVGGRRVGDSFWLVSEFGERSQYVRNIRADPRVRVRIRGRWHTGTAHLLADDDPIARMRHLPRLNSLAVRAMGVGTGHLTVRVDLEGGGSR
ncbi:nitroreductase family deazaflavin-dependent oxidoreductase [Streptomyces sp. MA25(2023)]|uniref:nitroreductase family deazaflavin-dependent oxidoreductase n=1 Tax=Streptomyces sp. MA25(2023) TaxID=3055078 RepID=UPI0025B07CA7|nr:nitroreductase family deazaflavin-dependent oxidoreductase [Streptomyces sp. MA25(2023)]MDN3253991.1 nitroreductase family deazaflavin-dependent oxidoreductase [Streptomyces sp. MA25(2023)]